MVCKEIDFHLSVNNVVLLVTTVELTVIDLTMSPSSESKNSFFLQLLFNAGVYEFTFLLICFAQLRYTFFLPHPSEVHND